MLFAIYCNTALTQSVIIKDSLLNIPIKNATLTFEKIGVTTNKNGLADISVFNNNEIITISHVAYNSKKIIKARITPVIYLKQKKNILAEITLIEKTKLPLSKKYPLFSIKRTGIKALESSTSGLLSTQSSVAIQESQSGGGSPNYRGMEANRLLLAID